MCQPEQYDFDCGHRVQLKILNSILLLKVTPSMPEPYSLYVFVDLTETIAPLRRTDLLKALIAILDSEEETTRYIRH
jgi:hypothetical protein